MEERRGALDAQAVDVPHRRKAELLTKQLAQVRGTVASYAREVREREILGVVLFDVSDESGKPSAGAAALLPRLLDKQGGDQLGDGGAGAEAVADVMGKIPFLGRGKA